MAWWQAIILGIIEGVTEFLPVSSTGHLTIVEKLMGMRIDDPSLTAFTAVIQIGAILAAIIYFWSDIWRVLSAWWRGLWWKRARRQFDYVYGWAIIIGSVPIAVIGLLFKDQVETVLRSLWFVAVALIGWSLVMWWADKRSEKASHRSEQQTTWRDTLAIGAGQCLAKACVCWSLSGRSIWNRKLPPSKKPCADGLCFGKMSERNFCGRNWTYTSRVV